MARHHQGSAASPDPRRLLRQLRPVRQRPDFTWGRLGQLCRRHGGINGPESRARVNAAFLDGNEDLFIAEFQLGVQRSKYLE
jgi:hypothetical protein